MTEKVKEVKEEVASPQEDVEAEEETSPVASQEENQPDESEDNVEADDSIDFQAENERLTRQLGQAEHTIVNLKKKKKTPIDPKPKINIKRRVDRLVEERLTSFKMETRQDVINEILDNVSTSPEERQVIKLYYEKKFKPTGFTREAIMEDIENAKILANKKNVLKENSELRQALASKRSIANTSPGVNQNRPEIDTTKGKLSEADLKLLEHTARSSREVVEGRVSFQEKLAELKKKAVS